MTWTIEYWYKEKCHITKSSFACAKGDFVSLWEEVFQVQSVIFFPEEKKVTVRLTQHFTT